MHNQTLIISYSILYSFERQDLPVDIFAIKGARTLDVHHVLDVVKSYDRVIFMIGGNDTDNPKRNNDGEMQMRHVGSPRQIAYEMEDLPMSVGTGAKLRSGQPEFFLI